MSDALSFTSADQLRHRMSPPNSPLFHFSLLTIILSINVQTYSQIDQDNPFVTDCHGEYFTLSSPYDSNLRLFLKELIASTPKSTSFFILDISTSPQIFGLAQCRPDVTPAVCSACLNNSAVASFNNKGCGLKKSFANRAGHCVLRYSDQTFYNSLEENLFVWYAYAQNASASFNSRVNILMKSVMASTTAAELKFAVANDSVDSPNIYGMGWCSMELKSNDCATCLSKVFDAIPAGKTQGNGAFVSCHLRFETYQFYSNSTLLPAPAPEAGAPTPEAGGEWPQAGGRKTMIRRVAIFLPVGILLLICTIIFLIWIRKRRDKGTKKLQNNQMAVIQGADLASKLKIKEDSMEFSLIKFSTIMEATDNFSSTNKLGQGGFGSVYKCHLPSGESMAVKRLDAFSGQGLEEFMNEIKLIAKLQHQNLVKLLGCCIEGDEKLLVYEYMPNKSLDYHLFDQSRKEQLDWSKRFTIIDGIAQGLLYLHKYSRVRIIHRDLKASNILLDLQMNPKISDFGLARIHASTTPTNTNRIVGTYGYMSPEYAMEGLFSVKSDVFSFGVLMLEIISGKRNTSFHKYGIALNLLVHAWELWKNENWLDFVDPSLGDKIPSNEVSKCIIVALMCVQEKAADRPIMSEIITMLSSENAILQDPKKPAFFTTEHEVASELLIYGSQNDITLTVLKGR
ncbi:hypothetical protein KFK09_021080 [Dendrobium nobile]|uniref:non-specific serine/threonine protein kinase n=1 Tax=Dendrobium nobile TaxID=94219 RepID=A0A8T3AQ37_DENNO|nr:hypothetical protein KFK09_021080 [Dendrobium nobile]